MAYYNSKIRTKNLDRKNVNTTLNKDLYKEIKLLALEEECGANDLLEEGMEYVLKKYKRK